MLQTTIVELQRRTADAASRVQSAGSQTAALQRQLESAKREAAQLRAAKQRAEAQLTAQLAAVHAERDAQARALPGF